MRLQAPAPYRKTRGLKARREELGAETPEEHEALSDGSYAVHRIQTPAPHHVFVSKDFKVTGTA